MADGTSVRVMSEYAPGEKETAANEGAFHGPTGEPNVKGHVAVSPNLLVPNGGAHWYGEHVNLLDKKTGEVLRKGLQIHDFSYWNKETPTKDSVELADDHELPDSVLVHDPEYPDEKPTEHQQNYGKISGEQLGRSQYRAGDAPSGATFKRTNSAPTDAIQKRPATNAELSASTSAYAAQAEQAQPTAKPVQQAAPQPEEEPSTEPPPFQAVPSNPVKNTSQLRQEALEQGEDPDEAVAEAHSEAVAENPDDNRVALRTNPDTGSIRMVGNYFVPGDEHHAELLSEMDPEHQAKLPVISQAINRGGPFSFMYGSAPQEGGQAQWEGESPTGESRGYEQSISPAQQRIAGGETQQQQVIMLPQQLVAEGKPGNRSVSLEGFGSQQAINNARNIIGGANAAKIPVPYQSHTDPNFQRDLMGFLENQGNGFRGDGSGPVLDESGEPHKSYKPENGYVPHLLQKPQAEFIHAALNIRPGKKKMSEGPAPSLRERAQWIRRINEAYAGHQAGQNTLLDKLDAKLPQVGVRNKKGDITRYVPWSHARGTLEATWRKYRPELMSHLGMPPIGSHSMRELAGAHMVHRHPVYRQHVAEFKEHPPAPISGNPEMGAPLGEGEKLASAAIHYSRSGKIYPGKGHYEATQAAMQAGEPHPWREMENGYPVHRGYLTNHGRFITDTELYAPKPAPIAQNPEVGAPLGEPDTLDAKYPRAGKYVDGRLVGSRVANQSSIGASLYNYKILPGIREIPMHEFDRAGRPITEKQASDRLKALRDAIAKSGRIDPLIVAEEDEGPYILEGGHRWDALRMLGAKSFPAMVARDLDLLPEGADPHRATPPPIARNPEVGAPAGTPNAPGEGGLLGAPQAGETEAESQTTPAEPSTQPSFEAYSPNLRDNMAFRTAKTALKKQPHQELRDFSSDLENAVANRYRKPVAQTKDIVGDWADSAENSLMSRVRGQHPDVRRLVQALKGTHGAQKQVLTFRPHDAGPHNMYSLRFNTDDGEEVRKLLDKQKLLYRSLELPERKGEGVQAHIVDTGSKNSSYNKLEQLFKKGHIGEGHHWEGTAELVGDPNGANRETARNEYGRILDEAEKAWHQNPPGGGGPFDRNADEPEGTPPWWKPFRDRAEENFQKLRESDLFQEQAAAQDLKEAAAHRQDKSAREKAEQKGPRDIAKAFVATKGAPSELGNAYFNYGHEDFPEWVKTKEDIAKFFGDRNPRLDYSKPEDRQKAIEALRDDAMWELAHGSEAASWYNRTVDRSLHKVSEIAPDILKNDEDKLAYLLSTAITSQGQEVHPNWVSGYLNYRHWKKHGEFSTDPAVFKGAGKALTAMVENFEKTNKLWKGTPDEPGLGTKKFLKFLETPMTMKQLEENYGTNVSGEPKGYTMEGSAFLGPKIGSFFNNLNKRLHTVTFDLWKARNMNRMAGNMFGFSESAMRGGTRKTAEPPHLDKLEEHLNNGTLAGHASASPDEQAQMRDEIAKLRALPPGITREQAMETAPMITQWAERAHKLLAKGAVVKPATEDEPEKRKTYTPRTEPNMLAKNFDENFHGLADAPRNGEEREQWREIEKGVQKELANHGIKITIADLQALDWWAEQKMFQKAGSRIKPLADYLDASHRLVRLVNTGFVPKLYES